MKENRNSRGHIKEYLYGKMFLIYYINNSGNIK